MYSFAQPDYRDGSLLQPSAAVRAARMGMLVFWLPLMAIGMATFSSEHQIEYANPAYIEDVDTSADVLTDVGTRSLYRELCFLAFGAVGAALLLKQAEAPIAWNW